MNKLFFSAALIAVASCVLLTACAPTTPQFDSRFGESTRTLVAQQTLNPDAGSAEVSESMDASGGREAVERYRTGFKEPQAASNIFTIGISGGR